MSIGDWCRDAEGKIEVSVEKRAPVALTARHIAHIMAWK